MRWISKGSLLFGFLFAGCCIPWRVEQLKVPSWVFSPPRSKDYVYAVGSAAIGVNYSQMVALARERALEKLAKSVYLYFYAQSEGRHSRAGASRYSLEVIYSKALLHAIEEGRWMDKEGVTGGRRLYLLMKAPLKEFQP